MDLRFTKLLTKNIIAIIGTIIALFAAIAAIGGNVLTEIIASACPINQWLWWCVAWHYMLFIFTVVAGVIGFIFFFAFAGDSITALGKWIPKKIQEYRDRPFNIHFGLHKDKNEVYLEAKNREWFIDVLKIYTRADMLYKGVVIQERIKWLKNFDIVFDDGRKQIASILRRKSELLNFVTVDQGKREFYVHLESKDLSFPFEFDGVRIFELFVWGLSSAPETKTPKHIINHRVLVEQYLEKNGQINFRIGSQW